MHRTDIYIDFAFCTAANQGGTKEETNPRMPTNAPGWDPQLIHEVIQLVRCDGATAVLVERDEGEPEAVDQADAS